jgi:hypothetical protein
MMALTHQILEYFNRAKKSTQDRVYKAPQLRTLGQNWLETVGRRIRRSLSPTETFT